MTSSDAMTFIRGSQTNSTAEGNLEGQVPAPSGSDGSAHGVGEPGARDLLARFQQKRQAVRVPVPLSRDRILDATEACLREHGYDGTTIRRIAGRLECAVGTIYRHFTDKRALLDAVVQRRFEPVVASIEQGQRLQETAALYLRTASEEPQQYRLMFWLASVAGREMPGVPEVTQRIIHGWGEQLGDHSRAERFWAQLHGAMMLGHNPRPDLIHADGLPAAAPASPAQQPQQPQQRQGSARTEDMTLL